MAIEQLDILSLAAVAVFLSIAVLIPLAPLQVSVLQESWESFSFPDHCTFSAALRYSLPVSKNLNLF